MISMLILIAIILAGSFAIISNGQRTAPDWFTKRYDFLKQKKCDRALQASDRANEIDPYYAMAWNGFRGGMLCSRQGCECMKIDSNHPTHVRKAIPRLHAQRELMPLHAK